MVPPIDPLFPRPTPTDDEPALDGLEVHGTLPDAVSGRLLGVHRGTVQCVHLSAGRLLAYCGERVRPDTRAGRSATDVVVFGSSMLTFGRGTRAHELSPDLSTLSPVDLAGRSRGLATRPVLDPVSGDLHFVTAASDDVQEYVVVSGGALTRRSRPVVDPPNPVKDLVISGDQVLFVADGFLGLASSDAEARIRWVPTGVGAPAVVHAHTTDETVVVIVLAPSLERWDLRPTSATVRRRVLDPIPWRFARTCRHPLGAALPVVWATVGGRACRFDLGTGRHDHRHFGPWQVGDLVHVTDPAGPPDADDGWLVGFVRDPSRVGADLVVLDAADIARPIVASVHIPRSIPPELHITWIPEPTSRQAAAITNQGARP